MVTFSSIGKELFFDNFFGFFYRFRLKNGVKLFQDDQDYDVVIHNRNYWKPKTHRHSVALVWPASNEHFRQIYDNLAICPSICIITR